jgi:hypothetical protein
MKTEDHEIAGILPQIKPMNVFIAVLLSSNVDEFDVVCILPSNAGNVYYQIVCGGYVSYIQIPCEALHENKTYIHTDKKINYSKPQLKCSPIAFHKEYDVFAIV